MGWTFCWFRVCLLILKFSNGWMWSKFSLWGQILQREWSSMFNFRSLLACSHTSVAVNCSQQLQGFEDDNLFVLTELRRRKTQPLSWPIHVGIRFLALWIMELYWSLAFGSTNAGNFWRIRHHLAVGEMEPPTILFFISFYELLHFFKRFLRLKAVNCFILFQSLPCWLRSRIEKSENY